MRVTDALTRAAGAMTAVSHAISQTVEDTAARRVAAIIAAFAGIACLIGGTAVLLGAGAALLVAGGLLVLVAVLIGWEA